MKRFFLMCSLMGLAVIGLMACDQIQTKLSGSQETVSDKKAVSIVNKLPQGEDSPNAVIGDMLLKPQSMNSYCSFFRNGHDFRYDDKSTWKFLIEDDFNQDLNAVKMKLDGDIRQLRSTFQNAEGMVIVRHFKTVDAPFIEVLIEMEEGETGYEATTYTGSMAIIKSKDGVTPRIYPESEVKFYGDCGV